MNRRHASGSKTVLTAAATGYQNVLGQRMAKGGDQPVSGATQPSGGTARPRPSGSSTCCSS